MALRTLFRSARVPLFLAAGATNRESAPAFSRVVGDGPSLRTFARGGLSAAPWVSELDAISL